MTLEFRSSLSFCALALGLFPAILAPSASAEGVGLNFSGAPGLIDMPSGEAMPTENLSFSTALFGPITRSTISFQAAEWMSVGLRSTNTANWNDRFCPPDCTGFNAFDDYFDRSLDLRFHILNEGQYRPAVTIGLMDILGPGFQSAEYIAATKHFGDRVSVSGGLGWGRLGSNGSLGAPFGARSAPVEDGSLGTDQLFRGDVAAFGGIEWQIKDRWSAKAEYSSDAYSEEAGLRGALDLRSPLNFGVEYQPSQMIRLGAYYLYGSEIGLAAHVVLDPGRRPSGSIGGTGPEPVLPRPSRSADPEAWSSEWVAQDGVLPILRDNFAKHVERSGIRIEALAIAADRAQVRFRNQSFDAEAQAVGRVARAMSQVMPASVEVFEIVPTVNGVPVSKVVLRRSDIEALEFAPNGDARISERAQIVDVGPPSPGLDRNPEIYPEFKWSIAPYVRLQFLEPGSPVTGDLGLRLAGRYEYAPGLVLSGSVTKSVFSNISSTVVSGNGSLPPVRSDAEIYRRDGDPSVETLTAAWYGRVGPDLFGRVTIGYLEQMYGGLSTELLWMPASRPWALGAEANYVAQRDTNGGLGFGDYDYQVLTGHLSGYLELGAGYHGQLDLGRFLAGDLGGTLTVTRQFENGWKLGAYVTMTDATTPGEFDRGVKIDIPLTWFTGQPNRVTRPIALQPFVGDAGARLSVQDRLHDLMYDYSASGMDKQWGRFWK